MKIKKKFLSFHRLSVFTIMFDSSLIELLLSTLFIVLYSITIISLIVVIIAENRNPLKAIPWVIVLLLAPVAGIIFYFFFGQDNRKQKIISRKTYKRILNAPKTGKIPNDACKVNEKYKGLTKLINRTKDSPLLYGSKFKIYTNGRQKFMDFFEDIKKAKHHIHIQYYIINDDDIGNKLKNLLIKKAQEGVKVRLIYDDVGCWKTHKSFFKEMEMAGIEVKAFLKVVFPLFTSKVNYRNHRKITVIDGEIGYIGGMNIADRYTNGVSWGVWRDLHFRLEGKGVHGLQSAFLLDWYVVSKEIISDKNYYPKPAIYTNSMMQIVRSGPINPWRVLSESEMYLITNARKYIFIQTPYFLPTEGLNQSLQVAARSGVDVRIMIPEHSDTKMAHLASLSFVAEMLRAGVKFYLYKPGFLHSKLIISDDYLACIGSANMDFRSLEHNFEINAFVYQQAFATHLRKIFLQDVDRSIHISAHKWLNRPLRKRFIESFMRLFSPLL